MAKIITISNQKGGVGKSTTAICLADALRHCDYSVLFVDLDAQCNSSSVYKTVIEGECTIVDLLNGSYSTSECIQHTDMGDIISGDPGLVNIINELDQKINRYGILKEKLSEVTDDYDFIIIDSPPGAGLYMYNSFFAADGLIIPLTGSQFAVDGLAKIVSTVQEVKQYGNPTLEIYGVLMNKYDARKRLDKLTWGSLPRIGIEYGFNVFKTPIRICQAVKEAQAENASLYDMSPNCNAAIDYVNVVKELLGEED